jgi:hypothetical protein
MLSGGVEEGGTAVGGGSTLGDVSQGGEEGGRPHWRRVVGSLGLNDSQRLGIREMHGLYLKHMSPVWEERERLGRTLAAWAGGVGGGATTTTTPTKTTNTGEREGPGGVLSSYSSTDTDPSLVLNALSSNLHRQHMTRLLVNCYVFGCCFTAVQYSKAAVYSYPVSEWTLSLNPKP